MTSSALLPLVLGSAAVAAGLAAALFAVKVAHHYLARLAGDRRAHYIGAVGEILARRTIPSGLPLGWTDDPVFHDTLSEFLSIVAGDERRVLTELSSRLGLSDRLAARARHLRRSSARAAAVHHLAELASPAHGPLFHQLFADRSPHVRLGAVRGLARLGDRSAVPRLIEALATEPPWIALRMADMLLAFGPSAVPHLTNWLQTRALVALEGNRQTTQVIRVVGLLSDAAAQPVLLELLDSADPLVRVRAAEALGRCGTGVGVPRLAAAMADADWRVRAQAASSLGMIRDPSALEALAAGTTDESWWVRQNSASALAEMPAGRERLAELAEGGTGEIVELASYQLALAGRRGT